ncbi:MAG TPA: hypothetical protein PKA74_10185, partial [Bauldia sp.]|nr:hypothetical protein [Bauldia sp.]
VNSGVLRGGSIAVRSILEPGATLTVTNQAKGLIAGPAAFSVNGGKLALTNHGKILGDVYDDVGLRTTVRNDGIIEGTTVLGGGNDSFNGSGGVQGRVYGGTGTDTLVGGSKGDWLDGGSDRDVLTGGGGADRFHFTQSSHSAPGATRDFITDFSRGQKDRIDIGDMAPFNFVFRGKQDFTGGGTPSVKYTQVNKAGTAKDRTIVHGDANGDGVADFQIELRGLVSLQASDFVL